VTDPFEIYIREVIARTLCDGGSASKPNRLEFFTARDLWCFPKYPARTAILPQTVDLASEIKEFITKNSSFLEEEDCWLGTWVNPHSGEYYLDVSTGVHDLAMARQLAMQAGKREGRNIVALFNPQKSQTIYLND